MTRLELLAELEKSRTFLIRMHDYENQWRGFSVYIGNNPGERRVFQPQTFGGVREARDLSLIHI